MTVGAVSQQVIKAEDQLGRAIFERTARGLRQTAFGTPFLARLSRASASCPRPSPPRSAATMRS
ncbi:hypothetical protein GCM10023069_00200 [Shinella granuli]